LPRREEYQGRKGTDPNNIGNTKVLMTMIGGKIVYQDVSWDGAPSK